MGRGLRRVHEGSEGGTQRGVEASVPGRTLGRPSKKQAHRVRGWGPRLIFQGLTPPLRRGVGIGIVVEILVGVEVWIVIGMEGEIEVLAGLELILLAGWGPTPGCKRALARASSNANPRSAQS